MSDRAAMEAILFVLHTGCQWNALSATGICSSSSAHQRLQEWARPGCPTDRGKGGVKRSLSTEAHGIPIAIAMDGANRHDMKLVCPIIEDLQLERPTPTSDTPQGLCLDKGYDYEQVREWVAQFGFTAHILARGEEALEIIKGAGFRARRWVVERTHSWMNRFRGLLIR